MFQFRGNPQGIVAMIAAMLALTLNFATVKLAGEALPLGELLFLRGTIAAFIIAAVCVATGAHRRVRLLAHPTVLLRTGFESTSATIYVAALVVMPIANATVILQALPLLLTAGAALFFGEIVRWRRWAAIIVGFVGVVIIIRPGAEGFQWVSILVLASVFLSAARDLATRRVPPGIPTVLVAGAASSGLALVGLVVGATEKWVAPAPVTVMQVCASGAFLATGLLCLIFAMRSGELSVIAPFRYSAVVWAFLLGWLIWGDRIDLAMLVGTAIIVGSGIYITYREREVPRAEHPIPGP